MLAPTPKEGSALLALINACFLTYFFLQIPLLFQVFMLIFMAGIVTKNLNDDRPHIRRGARIILFLGLVAVGLSAWAYHDKSPSASPFEQNATLVLK